MVDCLQILEKIWLGVHTISYYSQILRNILLKVGTLIEQFRLDTMKPNSYIYNVMRQNYAVNRKTV